jgi:hypothetical protein
MRRLGWLLFCLAPVAQACELPGGPAERVESGGTTVVYRAAPIQVGKHFALDLQVCPAPDALVVDAWMPAHQHGMNYRPSVTALGGGRYRAEGLMFHMPGRWEFTFELRTGKETQRLAREVRIE